MHQLLVAFAIAQLTAPSPHAPYREPQIAASGKLTAIAFGSGSSVFVATSTNNGETFGSPVRVAEAPVLPLSRHRGPRIAISGSILVVTAVIGDMEAKGEHSHGLPSDGDLVAWRSSDQGHTWSKPVRINDVPAAPREGLHTLAVDNQGHLFAAWLDQRDRGTQLFGAWSSASGATWSRNVKIYESPGGTICECCHPTAIFTEDGHVEVMWRNVLEGSRDFYLIASNGDHKFSAPQKLGDEPGRSMPVPWMAAEWYVSAAKRPRSGVAKTRFFSMNRAAMKPRSAKEKM
ncbi:MAG: exo-alpha-sialidase [Acidobacteriia bacterium]|nr:exo-alpha-sialidase [Terriglobia bacterium]